MNNLIDISQFEHNTDFYGELDLVLTVKNFDLQAIRNRYVKSTGNFSGRTGSVERRDVGTGGLVEVSLAKGAMRKSQVLGKFKEPRGIAVSNGRLAFSSENRVYILDRNEVHTLDHEWFSYIHTVDFSPFDPNKLLVSSSGYDSLFEFDLSSKEKTFEWFAWENGFDKGIDPETGEPVYLTRDPIKAKQFKANGDAFIEIKNPLKDVLPTAKRAAFINSVVYDTAVPGSILATFFHEGSVYRIYMDTGKAERIIEGLQKPHGAKNYMDALMVTSTGSGEVIVFGTHEKQIYGFTDLQGKPETLKDMEWLQNAIHAGKFMIGLDSNRTSFVVFDPKNGLYDSITYDQNWAIQDAVVVKLSNEQQEIIRNLAIDQA